MDPVTVLLMPGGGPGILAQLAALKGSRRYAGRAVLADCNPASGNLFLPEVDAAYRLPLCNDEAYLPALLRLIARESVSVLYSGLDEELPVLARHRAAIEARDCRLLLPPEEALMHALNKRASHELLNGHMPLPRTWFLDDEPDTDRIWGDLEGRVVIKAVASRGGRHVYMPDDREEYDYVLRRARHFAARENISFLVQALIEGTEYNVSTLHAADGRCLYAVCRRKFESRRMKSTTLAAVVERNDAVIAQALAAVQKLGLVPGFNNVELIADASGTPWLIEVNGGRTAAQDMNLVAAGINLTDLLIDLTHGRPVEPHPHPRARIASLKIRKDVIVDYDDIEEKVIAP